MWENDIKVILQKRVGRARTEFIWPGIRKCVGFLYTCGFRRMIFNIRGSVTFWGSILFHAVSNFMKINTELHSVIVFTDCLDLKLSPCCECMILHISLYITHTIWRHRPKYINLDIIYNRRVPPCTHTTQPLWHTRSRAHLSSYVPTVYNPYSLVQLLTKYFMHNLKMAIVMRRNM